MLFIYILLLLNMILNLFYLNFIICTRFRIHYYLITRLTIETDTLNFIVSVSIVNLVECVSIILHRN